MLFLPFLRHAVLIAACATGLSQTCTATIVSIDFDTNFGNYQYGYSFAGYGDPNTGNVDISGGTSQVTEIAVGAGISGTDALRVTMNASAAGGMLTPDRTYDYLGFAVAGNTGFSEPLSSGQLSDYTFAYTSRAEGFLPGITNGTAELYISIVAPDGTLGAADGNGDLLVGLRFSTGIALAEAFQTSTLNLGDAVIADGSLANFTSFFAVANQMNFVTTPNETNGRFGFDDGNAVVIDDVSLVVVPEPVSGLCLALGGLMVAGARRRGTVSLRERQG